MATQSPGECNPIENKTLRIFMSPERFSFNAAIVARLVAVSAMAWVKSSFQLK